MSEYEEVNNTPNEEVVNEAVAQAEREKQERRVKAVQALRDASYSWSYIYTEEASLEVLEQAVSTVKKFSEPLQLAQEKVSEWVEKHKEASDVFTEEIVELLDALTTPLNLRLNVEETVDVKAEFVVYYERKPWENKGQVISELLDNLSVSVTENYSDYLTDYSIDSIEEYR